MLHNVHNHISYDFLSLKSTRIISINSTKHMMNESMVRRNCCSNTQACTPRHAVFIMTEPSNTVKFNVGGRIFEVLRDTVLLRPSSTLGQMVKWQGRSTAKPIFIEGNSDLFPLMLYFLRFGKIYISITISKRAVLCEAAAFKLGVTPDDVAQDLPPRVNAFKTDQA
jgi:hypothetical protein